MELVFGLGTIRKAPPKDAETLASWWADGEIMKHAGFPNGLKTDLDKLSSELSEKNNDNVLCILEDNNKQSIGEMGFKINEKTATLGIKRTHQNAVSFIPHLVFILEVGAF